MLIKIKKLKKEANIPKYARFGDAGFDLCSAEDAVIEPGEYKLVSTGLAFEIPIGFEMQIRPRSGLASKHGISIVNSPGTIDSGYRGDVGIIIINHGKQPFEIRKNDRIAQGVIAEFECVQFKEVDSLSESERGECGFGHTGVD